MRRWLLLAAAALGILAGLVVGAVWHVSGTADGLNRARLALARVANNPNALRTEEGRAGATARIDAALDDVERAESKVRGSVPLRVIGNLPVIAPQRRGALQLVEDARQAGATSRALIVAIDDMVERIDLERGAVPLDGLAELQRELEQGARRLETLDRTPKRLWSDLEGARAAFNEGLSDTAARLRDGADAVGAARTFLGSGGPRRYFLAAQNNAEMRDQGMVLSYGVVRCEGGRLTFERTGPIGQLQLQAPVAVPVPAGTQTAFGALQPTLLWQSVNATADFAWSGRTMAAMYQQATGERVDGVIAMDVPGLAALLRAVGPVRVEGLEEDISAESAGRILLEEFYDDWPRGNQSFRRERLSDVASAVIRQLTERTHDLVTIGQELGVAAGGGHLKLWSAHRHEQAVFERTGLGGTPGADAPERTFHLSVQNATATKLDYYMRHRVRMDVSVTRDGVAIVKTAVTIRNTAPEDAAPSYRLGPDGFSQQHVGEYLARIYFWGPRGSTQLESLEESGLLLSTGGATIAPGDEVTVRFETAVPDAIDRGRLELRLVPQPTLVPARLDVRFVGASGWRLVSTGRFDTVWDRTLTLGWELRR